MEERRITPRVACKISLAYKLLKEDEFQELSEVFPQKRKKIVIYDKLVHENKKVHLKLHTLEDNLESILTGLNEQLKLFVETLSMDIEISSSSESADVVINLAGMKFETEEVLKPGQVMEIQIRLQSGMPRILLMGEVLKSEFSKELNQAFAVATFSYVEPDDKSILENFVDEHK